MTPLPVTALSLWMRIKKRAVKCTNPRYFAKLSWLTSECTRGYICVIRVCKILKEEIELKIGDVIVFKRERGVGENGRKPLFKF